jgi:hypothetical protein
MLNPRALTDADEALVHEAMTVLEENWLGHATRPSPRLYPHQWSWDSAFIAIGYSHVDQARAQQELRSLFRGQWSNGMLPHIVFTTGAANYFPGPEFWQTQRCPYAPREPRTSGIVQPPIHASAALEIYRNAAEPAMAVSFLEELLPRLSSWHTYLRRERVRRDDGLIEIWHPWESGMDNSPIWDQAMARLVPRAVRDYVRADLAQAQQTERPTDDDYDRYVSLVELFRDCSYLPERIRATTPFAVADVLYNSLWVQANADLAEICRLTGADPEPFERWRREASEAMQAKLWNDEHACYVDYDLVADSPVVTRIGPGFSPLFAGVPTEEQAARMVEGLTDSVGVSLDTSTWMVPSFDPRHPGFLPTNYWRGPIWINVNWVLFHGLLRYGYNDLASTLRRSLIEVPRRSGFYEHYDPQTGGGHGADRFAWTAALVLDLLFEGAVPATA